MNESKNLIVFYAIKVLARNWIFFDSTVCCLETFADEFHCNFFQDDPVITLCIKNGNSIISIYVDL